MLENHMYVLGFWLGHVISDDVTTGSITEFPLSVPKLDKATGLKNNNKPGLKCFIKSNLIWKEEIYKTERKSSVLRNLRIMGSMPYFW